MNSGSVFQLRGAAIITSFRCNLNCKYCGAYSPYLNNKLERSNDRIIEGLERFFKIVDRIEWLWISGGEPLIYKDFPDLLERLLAFVDKFDKLAIITNGTIVPNDEVITAVKKFGNKFHFFSIDNYGPTISKKIPEITVMLDENDIPFYIRDYYSEDCDYGGWVDMGDMYSELHTAEKAQELFEKCAEPKMGFCSIIADDIWYPCDQVFRRLDLGQKVDPNDYIDFTDDTLTIEQQREKLRRIMFDGKCLESCKYCNGLCKDSVRIKPAEQLTLEELKQIKARNII